MYILATAERFQNVEAAPSSEAPATADSSTVQSSLAGLSGAACTATVAVGGWGVGLRAACFWAADF